MKKQDNGTHAQEKIKFGKFDSEINQRFKQKTKIFKWLL